MGGSASVNRDTPIQIILIDDHEIVREGLRSFLSSEDGLLVVGEAADADTGVNLYKALSPHIVVMDLRLPGKNGIQATREIVDFDPSARVIVITTADGEAHIHAALEAGAWAYLQKDALRKEIVSAIRTVHAGRRVLASSVAATLAASLPRAVLSPREHEVLVLMAKGLRNREIGEALGTTEGTVKMQVKAILSKLDVTDRTEAVAVALQRGIIDPLGT